MCVCARLLHAGFIHLLFPNAKIIHCVRDFHDLLLSNFKYKFDDSGLEFSLRVGDLVAFFHSYREMMRHWEKVSIGVCFSTLILPCSSRK